VQTLEATASSEFCERSGTWRT